MTLPRSAAEVLSEHVIFAVECIDRVYLNLYQPWLQHELGVIGYLVELRGLEPLAEEWSRVVDGVSRLITRRPWSRPRLAAR